MVSANRFFPGWPYGGFGRKGGLRFAIGGLLGEPQFPQPYRVLCNEGVSRGDLRHGGPTFCGGAFALFLCQFLGGALVVRDIVQNRSFAVTARSPRDSDCTANCKSDSPAST